MLRLCVLVHGVGADLNFLGSFLYAIGFVGALVVPLPNGNRSNPEA